MLVFLLFKKEKCLSMTIETKGLKISEELKRKVEIVCRFTNVNYTIINRNIKSIKNKNIAMVKPHITYLKVYTQF